MCLATAKSGKANFTNAKLSEANLSRASLLGADLSGADFTGANFSHGTFSETVFIDTDLTSEIREYYIADFTAWKDHDAFEAAVVRLLRDLKAAERQPGG